jgi:predicted AAA+ superfamily ATPase
MSGNLKPWREVAVPHEDVLKGTFQQAEFAADLSRVHDGSATAEYQDAALFFQRTFITEGMRLLLDSVVRRLAGQGGDPVIQLQTAFGGGKTHTMLAVYHLAKGTAPASALQGIPPILDAAGIPDLPKARIAVLDGNKMAPNTPQKYGAQSVRTLWGDLAWQLGGESAYASVREADESGTSPGKKILADLLQAHAPCVILMDELVAYIRQFEDGKTHSGGTYDSNLSFLQALTEALKAVPTAVLLASLPESDKESGSARGAKALRTLEHYFGRVQALWKPVATEEAFEIVRRRLFTRINDTKVSEAVCRAYADFYVANADDFPNETQQGRYYDRLVQAYPIHPEVFDRLYEDWSSLDNFQRTRGVLKLMAKVIHRLWTDGNNDLLIMPGSLPLYDADVRNDSIYYLAQGWDPVLERDIDGPRAETTELENKDTRFGSVQACRRIARTIYFGSAPHSVDLGTKTARGVDLPRIMLGVVQPGQQTGVFKDALRKLNDILHYMSGANDRYWFDTRPNLRREMEERKRRFQDKEDVVPVLRTRLSQGFASGLFGGLHVFTPSSDVPDDWALRLVVLPPDAGYTKNESHRWQPVAEGILKQRGEQPRQKQNRLLFLAPDYDVVSKLKDQVRTFLAWQSIVADIKEMKLNLDQFQARQANKSLAEAEDGVKQMNRQAYKWLLAPVEEWNGKQSKFELKWESFQLNPGAQNFSQEIERVLKDNELLISQWSPVHLSNLLKKWFWKEGVSEVGALDVWQKTNQYLYLPRLKDDNAFRTTLAAGASSRDFFGLAYGKEDGKYIGFSFGESTTPILDGALLLVEPGAAAAFDEAQRAAKAALEASSGSTPQPSTTGPYDPSVMVAESATVTAGPGAAVTPKAVKRRFFGHVELDPILAKKQFADIVDEVVLQFTSKPGVKVRVSIHIEADAPTGVDDSTQRAVNENCKVLKFKSAEFEAGE